MNDLEGIVAWLDELIEAYRPLALGDGIGRDSARGKYVAYSLVADELRELLAKEG